MTSLRYRLWSPRLALSLALAVFVFAVLHDVRVWEPLLHGCQQLTATLFTTKGLVLGHMLVLGIVGVAIVRLLFAVLTYIRNAMHWKTVSRTATVYKHDDHVLLLPTSALVATTVGLLRPVTYVSTGLRTALSDTAFHAVLHHEQQHRSSRDPLKIFCLRLLASALPFFPMMQSGVRDALTAIEQQADRSALDAGFSGSVLEQALRTVTVAPAAWAAGFAVVHDLRDRVLALRGKRPQRTHWASLAATLALCASIWIPSHLVQASVKTAGGACAAPLQQRQSQPMTPAAYHPQVRLSSLGQ